MSQEPNEDLFRSTTMTFGEHLEELRVALFRSLVGLVIGFLIGLLVAKYVVLWIQTPLKSALKEHYEIQASERLDKLYGDDLDKQVETFMKRSQLVFEEVYIERSELMRLGTSGQLPPDATPSPTNDTRAARDPGESTGTAETTARNQGKSTGTAETAARDPGESTGTAETAARDPGQATGRTEMSITDELMNAKLPVPNTDMVKTRIWRESNSEVSALSAQESFMIWLKAAFVAGLLIASPYIFWQIWTFVAAGLYSYERRYVYLFVPISLGLFWSGAALAFFFAFQHVLAFLLGFNRALDIQSEPRISEWMGFVLFLPLGFGIAFQLPLVMLFLNRIGIFSVRVYFEKWRIAILVICVLSMILTPADPISMLLMAGPLTVLYFLGIAMAQWMPRGRNPFTEAYEP